ncbi:MAG: hypothetical protein O7D91_04925 [Planctomycetota bacterium]|nr:hypothetical protein [Planctomycetota bacterium]
MEESDRDNLSMSEDEGRQHAGWFFHFLDHAEFGITELRALSSNNPPLVAYVDNEHDFVELAMWRNRLGEDVYCGVQPRPLELFDKAPNEWRLARGSSNGNVASSRDIEVISNLAVDIDSNSEERRKGHPASDDELASCSAVADRLLESDGIVGVGAAVMSGNGVHVFIPIVPLDVVGDIPANLKALERELIASLSPLPPGVRIDVIADPPRIIRVPGGVNHKGTPTAGRPHRRSYVLKQPSIGGRSMLLTERILHMTLPSHREPSTETCLLEGDVERFQTCEFVKFNEREAASIPEPVWMEMLIQCCVLKGGDGVAHRLSSLDQTRYSIEQTQGRLDRIKARGYRPKRCEHLPGLNGLFRCPRLLTCPAQRPYQLAAVPFHQPSQGEHEMNETHDKGGSKKPEYSVEVGAVCAAVWWNTREVNGQLRQWPSIKIVKKYRDRNGDWQETSCYGAEDLPHLAAVTEKVSQHYCLRESWPAKEAEQPEENPVQ